MRNLDSARLIRLIIAGAIAGLFVFLILNPTIVAQEESQDPMRLLENARSMAPQVLWESILLGLIIGGLTAGCITLADEFSSLLKRLALRFGIAIFAGIIAGALCGFAGQMLFGAMLRFGGIFFLLPARILGWGLLGVGAGMGPGLATGSAKRIKMSVIGGLVGGLIGGALFDVVSVITMGGSASRLLGFVIMCAAVGAAISFVEDYAKQNWVTILTGAREGKSYILTKPTTILGRDELADIPLFGDTTVGKQHALLQLTGNLVTLQAIPGAALLVNGAPVTATQLKDSDTISVGKHMLRFHQKPTQNVYIPSPQFGQSPYSAVPPYQYGAPQPAVVQAKGALSLTVVMGPHESQIFNYGPGLIKIGREADCQICLSNDTMISRYHAEIGWDGMSWHIRDAGSRNGLWINGARATQEVLNFGDQIGVGQTVMRVDGI